VATALIDADVICYKASAVAQSNVDWDDGEGPTPLVSPAIAKGVAESLVQTWAKVAGCKEILCVFSDRDQSWTFRQGVYSPYKQNRIDMERPELHDMVRLHIMEKFDHFKLPGLEGDDTMGLLATGEGGGKFVIVSIDKDMATVPVKQINPDDKAPIVRKINAFEADYNWMTQALVGDSVDNYKGCPNVGPVKAKNLLAGARNLHAMYSRVEEAFIKANMSQKNDPFFIIGEQKISPAVLALMNARVARILRDGDYNRKRNEVKLWEPTGWGDDTWTSVFQPEETNDRHDSPEDGSGADILGEPSRSQD
jgi:DNA polymerase-1